MQRVLEQLQQKPDPTTLRETVLEELRRATEASSAGCHGLGWDDEGRLRVSSVAFVGDPVFCEKAEAISGHPYDDYIGDEAELIEMAVPFEHFILALPRTLPPRLVERLWRPLGITSGVSINVDDQGRFVDNVMAIRGEGEPLFTSAEVERARPLRHLVKSVMRTAATLESSESEAAARWSSVPRGAC